MIAEKESADNAIGRAQGTRLREIETPGTMGLIARRGVNAAGVTVPWCAK